MVTFLMDHHVSKASPMDCGSEGSTSTPPSMDNAAMMSDQDRLDRATELCRVLVTSDEDFLSEAERRQAAGIEFAGIVYGHSLRVSIRTFIDDLEVIARVSDASEMMKCVEYLPL